MFLATLVLDGQHQAVYRENTSDYNVLLEVINQRIYRRARLNFDVEPGEHWLDLGANIGAFAIYCHIRGATADCFEPDRGNYQVLLEQSLPGSFTFTQAAVTHHREAEIPFWRGKAAGNCSKFTAISSRSLPDYGKLPNIHASELLELYRQYNGIKMDIEGSEGPLIDEWLIPPCKKLVMEYHTSADKSPEHLASRLAILRQHFEIVQYPPEYDRITSFSGNPTYRGNQLTFFDRMIFCKNPR